MKIRNLIFINIMLPLILSSWSSSIFGSEVNERNSWIGDWASYDNSKNSLDKTEAISISEFDGELIFASSPLTLFNEAGTRGTFSFSDGCLSKTPSKDLKKFKFTFSGCANTTYNGRAFICELKVAKRKEADEILCGIGPNRALYFKRIIQIKS